MTAFDREQYEERAAIMEYCANLPRKEAERLAMEDLEHTRRNNGKNSQ